MPTAISTWPTRKSNNRIQKFTPSLQGLVAELLRSVASVDWEAGIAAALARKRTTSPDAEASSLQVDVTPSAPLVGI